jgi:hypothetical protein
VDPHSLEDASGPGFGHTEALDDVVNRDGFAMCSEVILGAQALFGSNGPSTKAGLTGLFGNFRFSKPHSADLLRNGMEGTWTMAVCCQDSELLNGDRAVSLANQIRQALFVFRQPSDSRHTQFNLVG